MVSVSYTPKLLNTPCQTLSPLRFPSSLLLQRQEEKEMLNKKQEKRILKKIV